mgnify:CR=1 FL=1
MQHRQILNIITDETQRLLAWPYELNLAHKEHLTGFVKDVVSDLTAREFLQNNQGMEVG